jgi:hypothetical protein
MKTGVLAGLCCAVALAGCKSGVGGSDGDGAEPICQVVGSGNAISGSTYANPVKAFDGSLESFATLSPAASASGTISGGGISRMAGEVAGVAITRPLSGSISVTITTYKGGIPADTGQAAAVNYTPAGQQSTCPSMNCLERSGVAFFGIDTLQDFDEIEAAISISNFSAPLELRELCVN